MDPIVIEDDIIDLDATESTPEEFVYEWDAKCRKKLSIFAVADNENILSGLMKEYLESLQEMVNSYGDNEILKKKVFCHMSFLHSYYVELHCYTPDTYLYYMEDMLTIYCNLQLEVIRPLKKNKDFTNRLYKKKIVAVCRHMIHILTVYLLERNDHVLHVLIKMNTTNASELCSEVLNVLYEHFLTKVPAFNLCDESFCRSYIVFQKWKEVRKEDRERMDQVMYRMFQRTPESIQTNETLRKILTPACESTVDIVLNVFRPFREISNAYFKHIASKKNSELDDFNFNIDLGEDEPVISVEDDCDELKFMQAYSEVERNMSNLPHTTNYGLTSEIDIGPCKEEIEEEEEFFVDVSDLPNSINGDEDINEDEEINDDDETHELSSMDQIEDERFFTPAPPKSPDLEPQNGIAQICIDSVTTVIESPRSTQTPQLRDLFTPVSVSTSPQPHHYLEDNLIVTETEANQPKVPTSSDLSCNTENITSETRTIERKSVEVQAVEYGITTPPFDVTADEQNSRLVQPCLYTNIGQSHKDVVTRSVEVQVDPPAVYNDYGLTPPSDANNEELGARIEENCLYTDIRGHKTDEKIQEEMMHISEPECDEIDNSDHQFDSNSDTEITPKIVETNSKIPVDQDSECEDRLDTPETSDDIHIESCNGTNSVQDEPSKNPEEINVQLTKDSYNSFQPNDQIDTGQEPILNTAPNIETNPSSHKDLVATNETFNGNTVLKPLPVNRTNSENRDITSSPAKIMYTSTHKIKSASLDDFSRFENAMQLQQWNKMKENHDFDEILSGPVTKITPANNNLLSVQDKLDIFGSESNSKTVPSASSRSNSPTEMTSPAYEAIDDIDDFRNYFSGSVNGRVPPPHDVPVPQGILKKTTTSRRKKDRIMFHESTRDNSEGHVRSRREGCRVAKSVNRDLRLKQRVDVEIRRISFIENDLKKVLNKSQTIQVIYDKTTNHINEKDVVRCVSPPRLTWNLSKYMPSKGKVNGFIEMCRKRKSSKCEKNQYSCCTQLAEQFNKLNCSVLEENALNLTLPETSNPESEFSNSPKFLQDTEQVVKKVLEETSDEATATVDVKPNSLLCDNSNFYTSQSCLSSNLSKADNELKSNLIQVNNNNSSEVDDIQLPTPVPESYDFEKNLKNEVFSKIDWQNLEKEDSDGETRLPLKKRKVSVASKDGEEKKEEISYPATPMISIAEVEALHPRKIPNSARPFKTPAERKEMPPLPVYYNSDPSPIITDQFNINNHTYNNPTINYHMNNVPVPFINIPCGSYYSLPPILVPFNNVSTFDQNNKLNAQQAPIFCKKENRKQGRQKKRH